MKWATERPGAHARACASGLVYALQIGKKLGDVVPSGAEAAASAAMAPPPMPEVSDLLSAARVGDEEAVEDFIAVGKVSLAAAPAAAAAAAAVEAVAAAVKALGQSAPASTAECFWMRRS